MTEGSDWLSRLLHLVPISGLLEHRYHLGAPWQLRIQPAEPGEIPYYVVLAGSATLEEPAGAPPRKLMAGDIALLLHGTAHILSDGGSVVPERALKRRDAKLTLNENDGTGDRLDILCGRITMTAGDERLFRNYLPSQLVVSAGAQPASGVQLSTTAKLATLVDVMRTEANSGRIGGRAVLAAVSTAAFALALRLASEGDHAPRGLLALAGQPRLVPALKAILNEPAHPWTLPELAVLCGVSRATFVRQFSQSLGRSAADLLKDVRMTVAASHLSTSSIPTSAVAKAAGYQSDAAFQRAFTQHCGVSPAQYRKLMQRVGP